MSEAVRVRAVTPPTAVLDAFGVNGPVHAVVGGQGTAAIVGDIVLKPADDAAEAAWTCELLSRIRVDGFRVAEPVTTVDGHWVHDGWTASVFIPGLRPLAPRWGDVIDAGLRFGDAADAAMEGDRGVLGARTHRWAIADRVAWGEASIGLSDGTADLFETIAAEFDDAAAEPHFVHGDLSGNVFVDDQGMPVVLDVSPYLRPRRWAAAIVVCDALLWHHADPVLAHTLIANGERSLLFRALAFRLLADELASHLGGEHTPHATYRTVIASLS